MKKPLLFTLALCCFFLSLIAQGPTLTSANTAPIVGEKFQSQYTKAGNVDDKTGGANQTWDYTNLVDSGAAYNLVAVTPSSTPFADSFPSSNLVLKTLYDSAYLYFNSQTTGLSELGAALSDSTVLRYTKPKIYLPYPFSYGDFFTDSVVEQSAGFDFVLRGKDSLYGDGYGTLKTPVAVYNNALRVKYIEYIKYSTDTLGITTTIIDRTVNYIYFTPDTHSPLMSIAEIEAITTSSVLGQVIFTDTIHSKSVSYLKKVSLPLLFVSFNASLNNNTVQLQWQTAQENNTGNFNVQRSVTGTNFTDIAEIKATGSFAVSQYRYADESFAKTGVPPSVFYRIKETDKDGKEFYSKTEVVHGNTSAVSLYPNPAINYINLNIKDAAVADAISIYDAKGHLVKQYFNYSVNQPVNVSGLSKGTYFVQVKIKDKTTTTTVVKE